MLSSKQIVSSKPPHDAKKLFIHINKINTDIIMNKKIPHKTNILTLQNISPKAQNECEPGPYYDECKLYE
jgi:hypothetical protein